MVGTLPQNSASKNLYDYAKMSKWKTRDKLDEDLGAYPGVYMLYDQKANSLYIGKGKNVCKRIKQHTKDQNDSMRDFTHYRYTGISGDYYDMLFWNTKKSLRRNGRGRIAGGIDKLQITCCFMGSIKLTSAGCQSLQVYRKEKL